MERGRKSNADSGQATVEAAVAIPLVFLMVLLLVQPAIILYDRMVMASAAAEGCRLLATGATSDEVDAYVRRRLGAVPEQDLFHVHGGECTWEVQCDGGGAADQSWVTVRTQVRPLPLFDGGAVLAGLANEKGYLTVEVMAAAPTRPSWAQQSLGGATPGDRAGDW